MNALTRARSAAARLAQGLLAVSLLVACRGPAAPDTPVATPATAATSGPVRPSTAEERALYREAVRRVDAFEAANQPLLAAGRATAEAKRLYRDRLRTWQTSWQQLREYERDGITVARRPVVLSTGLASIKSFQDDAAEVVLTRCTDQSEVGMTRNGTPLPTPQEPVVQEVVVYRYENRTWLIGPFVTTDRPC